MAMIDDRTQRMVEQHQVWETSLGRSGKQLVAADVDFHGANLAGIQLADAEIPGADFSGALMAGANLSGCNLASAKFSGADLSGAALVKSNLDYADFTDARLIRANIRRASLIEAILINANLEGADLRGSDLSDADLSGATLAYVQFERTIFDGARFSRANLHGATGVESLPPCRIDVGTSNEPNILKGEAARTWLLKATAAAEVKIHLDARLSGE
jgi:uncharacterized protein YjbI with pentapeptide repeats